MTRVGINRRRLRNGIGLFFTRFGQVVKRLRIIKGSRVFKYRGINKVEEYLATS